MSVNTGKSIKQNGFVRRISVGFKYLLLLFACSLTPYMAVADCTWGVSVINIQASTCEANGSFTIDLTGADVNNLKVLYSVPSLGISPNSSPIFLGIPAGTYEVVVEAICSSNANAAEIKTIDATVPSGDVTYVPPALTATLTRNSLGCTGALGRVTFNFIGSSSPFNLKIVAYPAAYLGPFSFSTSANWYMIDNLPEGEYSFQMEDNICAKNTEVRKVTVKALTLTAAQLPPLNYAYPGNANNGTTCDVYNGQNPYVSASVNYNPDWVGFNTPDTPFEYAMSFADGTYMPYQKMHYTGTDNLIHLPLPAGEKYSEYYGKSGFLKMKIKACGTEVDASSQIYYNYTQLYTQTFTTAYTAHCDLGFTRSFYVSYGPHAICYPVTVTLKNSASEEVYTGTINGPAIDDKITTGILPYGVYTVTYATSDGGSVSDSFVQTAPSATPYSVVPYISATGLNKQAQFFEFTYANGDFNTGATIELTGGPSGYTYKSTNQEGGFYRDKYEALGNQSGTPSQGNYYWPSGDYEWTITDDCGAYTLRYTIAPADLYEYTIDVETKVTCDGLTVTPTGTALFKGAEVAYNNIYFQVYSGPTGYPSNYIEQGQSFNFQAPGTYKIMVGANQYGLGYFGHDINIVYTTIVYTKDAPVVDILNTTGFVCIGEADNQGQITATATKGVSPYTYYLYRQDNDLKVEIAHNTTGVFPNTLGLERGKDYIVKVVDACLASSSDQTVPILDLSTAQLVTHNKKAFCEGEQLEFTAIALPNPSYQWYFNGNPIAGSQGTQNKLIIPNLTTSNSGNYNVIIISTNCNLPTASPLTPITVSTRPIMPSEANVLAPDFCSGSSGKVTIKASLPGVTYQLYNATTDGTVQFSGVGTGGDLDITVANTSATYYLEVINAQGCIQTGSRLPMTMNVLPAPIISTRTSAMPSCFGGNDGSITIIAASGGTLPYEYSKDAIVWQANPIFTDLISGVYSIRIRDAKKCSSTISDLILGTPSVLDATFTSTDADCHGASTGVITVAASGGTAPHQYFINKGAGWQTTNPVITGLSAGSYEVKIVDAKGCAITSVPQIIAEPTAITLNITNKLAASCGAGGGSFTAVATGGTPYYIYRLGTGSWTGSGTFTNLQVGTYNLQVMDQNDCVVNETVTIESNLAILTDAFSFSDGPASYGIAQHAIASCLYLGGLDPAKAQDVAQPSDAANTALNDDGINGGQLDRVGEYTNLNHANFKLDAAGKLTATVQATNLTATSAKLFAWIDFNQNGVFDSGEASALINVAAGTLNQPFTAVWTNAGTQFRNGITYLRVRITSENLTVADANKAFADGEVEDYQLNLQLQSISKTAIVQGTAGKIANIGDIVEYQMTLTNHLPTAVNMEVFDYVPANTEYIAGSANPNTATYNNVTKKLSWTGVNLGPNASATFKFEAKVISYPDTTGGNYPAKIPNIAYAVKGTDTINSAKDCDLSEITVNPVIANDDCGITMINTQRYFDILKNDIPPIFIPFDLKATVGTTASIHLADTTLMYKPLLDYVGLDSVEYKIGVVGRSRDSAKVRIAVVKPLSEKFQFCPNVVDSIGVAPIPKVTFKWYKQNGTPATSTNANGNKLEIKMGTSDTIFYVAAIINGCVTDSIPINVYKASLQIHPDIRLHACPMPNKVINLASYLDTTYFTGVTWTHIGGAPIAGVQGQINSKDLDGTSTYKFKIDTYCGSSEAKFYVTSNTINKVREEQTIVVCHEFAESLHLLQMLGIEAGGSWTIPVAASSYVKTATLAPLTGAMIFNGKQAYDDVPGSDPQEFEFIYTAGASSCIPNKQIKLKIILTDAIL